MIPLILLLLAQLISPGDSCWKLVELGNIPERALLFAEAASREGGDGGMDLAVLLELSGRFDDAGRCYGILGNTSDDPILTDWITGRLSGCSDLDTLVILSAIVRNESGIDARDVTVEIPLPESQGPYQTVSILAGPLKADDEVLRFRIPVLGAGETLVLPVVLEVQQEPTTFRPFSDESLDLDIPLRDVAELIRSVEVEEESSGNGPCLPAAQCLRELGIGSGVEFRVVGGLFREGDSLLFHAWNILGDTGFPVDVLLFQQDSLRGMGHSTTDLIPLWDFQATHGHEVSVFYPAQDVKLSVSMEALLAGRDEVMWILDFIPLITAGYR